ncbi:hypothetical protein ACJX0J_035507, partial [Zea mays]
AIPLLEYGDAILLLEYGGAMPEWAGKLHAKLVALFILEAAVLQSFWDINELIQDTIEDAGQVFRAHFVSY